MIVIWTPNSIGRRYVRGEASAAADQGKLVPVVFEGIDPPLGFRTLHMLRVGPAGTADHEFVRSLVRAVEERLNRTLTPQPSAVESTVLESSRDISSPPHLTLPLDDSYSTLAVTTDCIWLGKHEQIEVRESRSGIVLGGTPTAADALFAPPIGNDVVCFGWGIGYQSPDSVRLSRWKLKGALEDIRRRNLKVEDYVPGPWESSRDSVAKQVRRDSILETDLFVTFAWQPDPVDLSEDGHKIAVFVDVPEKRIQIGSAHLPNQPTIYLPLGDCYPDKILLLQGADELVTLEHRKADGTSCVSLWNVGSGQRVAKYDFDYMTVNSFCRTGTSRLIALGLDQSVVFINVGDGTVEAHIEIDTRPVQSCAFDSQANRVGLLTNEEAVVIDLATTRTWRTLKHLGSKAVACDLSEKVMAALVATSNGKTNLIIWDLAAAAELVSKSVGE